MGHMTFGSSQRSTSRRGFAGLGQANMTPQQWVASCKKKYQTMASNAIRNVYRIYEDARSKLEGARSALVDLERKALAIARETEGSFAVNVSPALDEIQSGLSTIKSGIADLNRVRDSFEAALARDACRAGRKPVGGKSVTEWVAEMSAAARAATRLPSTNRIMFQLQNAQAALEQQRQEEAARQAKIEQQRAEAEARKQAELERIRQEREAEERRYQEQLRREEEERQRLAQLREAEMEQQRMLLEQQRAAEEAERQRAAEEAVARQAAELQKAKLAAEAEERLPSQDFSPLRRLCTPMFTTCQKTKSSAPHFECRQMRLPQFLEDNNEIRITRCEPRVDWPPEIPQHQTARATPTRAIDWATSARPQVALKTCPRSCRPW